MDFVHFMWQNFEHLSVKKYAITLLLPDDTPEPRLLCLSYYRAASDGWRDNGNCEVCVLEYQQTIRLYSGCRQPNDCSCHIFRRQPLTMQDFASQSVFHLINIDWFELTADKTHRQYVQAVLSCRAKLENLLPPQFPPSGYGSIFTLFSTNASTTVLSKGYGMWRWKTTFHLLMRQFSLSQPTKIHSGATIAIEVFSFSWLVNNA
jgi:hypothetical protein